MANKPTTTLRDGRIKATIWRQSSENGDFFRVNFTRSYQDNDGAWHDSDGFSGSELLRLAHLAQRAYDRTNELRKDALDATAEEPSPEDGRLS